MTVPRLELEGVSCAFDGRTVVDGVSLSLAAGQVTCLLGPSGCGKSTTLRIAAGIERLSGGRVLIDGAVVDDARTHIPPERRHLGMMFQDFALFPHLTAAENVAFGLTERGGARAERVETLLNRVGLAALAESYPHQMSGGEQQRVALARALAPRPRVMLMDEPFSGLDKRLRDGIRDETLEILRDEGTAVLLVTHEPEEAMRMGDQIALMRAGRIVQAGRPYNIYNAPVDQEAAAFFSDINVIHAEVRDLQATTPFGIFLTPNLKDHADVEIIIRPQHLKITIDRNGHGPRPSPSEGVAARGVVRRARFIGSESVVDLVMDHDGSTLTATVPGVFLPDMGVPLWLTLRRDRCFVFACRTQSTLEDPYIR